MHRNHAYWNESDRFRPERFITDSITSYSFIPFSISPRKCLGEKYAIDSIRIIVHFILKNFNINLKQNAVIKYKQSPLILQYINIPFYLTLK